MGLFSRTKAAPSGDQASKLVNLTKEAGVVLEKRGAANERAAVYLVLDHSGSMRRYYDDGTVQDFAEKVLAASVNLDDDGSVPVLLFDSSPRRMEEVSVHDYEGSIQAMKKRAGHMGTTNYADAMRAVIEHHMSTSPSVPALVVFQTDGSPDSRREAEKVLCEASSLPIFWQFVGFGSDSFDFLLKLDELPVPAKRVIDNAGFFKAGDTPRSVVPSWLYEQLLGEFPEWLRQARAQGIVRG